MSTTLFSDVMLPSGISADVLVSAGRIARIAGPGTLAPDTAELVAGAGLLLAPSFVEGHIHLDKTLLGLPFISHLPGDSVGERIEREKQLRRSVTLPVLERGAKLIEQIVPFGTGLVRSHVDIDTEIGLAHLEQLLALRERYARLIDLQIVAFPQSGILRDPGTADLLDAALSNGADLIGGLDPAGIDGDISGHLDVVFGLAEKHGAGIDIHLHDGGLLGLFELTDIAARTKAAGLGGRVAVSHAFCLGEPLDIGPTLEALAGAGVAIMTNGPGPVPMPPVKRLHAAGVTIFAGSDNIRDAWAPYGNGDMLERAMLIGYRQGLLADADIALTFDMATHHAARALGVTTYGIAEGQPADLVLIPAGSTAEAVATRPARRMVMKAGLVVAANGVLVGR